MRADPELRCQELVIGSGPGGAITACLLAERGRDVIVAEEGGEYPPGSCEPFSIGEMRQKYRSGGLTVALGSPKIAYVEGRVAGGGSEINSGLYHRLPDGILEDWRRDYGVLGADPAGLDPHCAAVERDVNVCLMPTPAGRASLRLAAGAAALGWRAMEVPRWIRYDGTRDAAGVAQGVRQSMSRTYLARARAAGARIITGARALRLERRGDGWVAECRIAGTLRQIRAGHAFACAGAVHTPFLLRNSGISRNIGGSLAMHPTVKVLARFPDETGSPEPGVHQVKEFSPRMSFGCSIASLPHVMLGLVDYPRHRARIREQWRHMAAYYAMVTGPATGRIRPVPFSGDPLVRYQIRPADRGDLALGLRRLCRLLFEAGAVELFPSIAGMEPLTSPDQVAGLPDFLPADRASLMTIHLFSSCPMGEDRRVAACDSFGRVHGVPGLSVHDASLLCTAPGVNPQGAVMAFARRNTMRHIEAGRF